MKNITLSVKGMHCRSCEMLIDDALSDIGAKDIAASHTDGRVSFSYDGDEKTLAKIKQAIVKEGYTVL